MEKLYNCLIIDDNEIDRLTTTMFVKQYPFLKIEGIFDNPLQALNIATKTNIDIIFCDIDMPQMSGLELRKKLGNIDVCIFITSYPDYAVDSFEVQTLDFIVKPIKSERFAKTMERLQQYLNIKHKAELLDISLGGDIVFIKEGHQQIKIHLHQILYLEALKDYTSIVTKERKYCVLNSLGNLLKDKVFNSFVRIHRSYAVQKIFIEKMNHHEVFIHNISIPVGRTYKDELNKLQ